LARREESSEEVVLRQGQGRETRKYPGSGKEEGAAAKTGKIREAREVSSDVPRRTVRLVKVGVP
jgi:hypothetical protein